MPDIQMCPGYVKPDYAPAIPCAVRNSCYRYTAIPSRFQPWGPPAEDFKATAGCGFWLGSYHTEARNPS
jgi:hypothetical protein